MSFMRNTKRILELGSQRFKMKSKLNSARRKGNDRLKANNTQAREDWIETKRKQQKRKRLAMINQSREKKLDVEGSIASGGKIYEVKYKLEYKDPIFRKKKKTIMM